MITDKQYYINAANKAARKEKWVARKLWYKNLPFVFHGVVIGFPVLLFFQFILLLCPTDSISNSVNNQSVTQVQIVKPTSISNENKKLIAILKNTNPLDFKAHYNCDIDKVVKWITEHPDGKVSVWGSMIVLGADEGNYCSTTYGSGNTVSVEYQTTVEVHSSGFGQPTIETMGCGYSSGGNGGTIYAY
jgi:hypothetical protein